MVLPCSEGGKVPSESKEISPLKNSKGATSKRLPNKLPHVPFLSSHVDIILMDETLPVDVSASMGEAQPILPY